MVNARSLRSTSCVGELDYLSFLQEKESVMAELESLMSDVEALIVERDAANAFAQEARDAAGSRCDELQVRHGGRPAHITCPATNWQIQLQRCCKDGWCEGLSL